MDQIRLRAAIAAITITASIATLFPISASAEDSITQEEFVRRTQELFFFR